MPADLTREEIERMRDLAAMLDTEARATMTEFGQAERLLRAIGRVGPQWVALVDSALSEPTRLAQARAEGYREAVARAMPEAIYVDSEAVVESIDGFGNYMVARGSSWFLYERFEGWWFKAGDVGELPNSHMVGTWIVRLPDLPTPTAAQEATDAEV